MPEPYKLNISTTAENESWYLDDPRPGEIKVEFNYKGKNYKGTLGSVNGAAGNLWHLMIDKRYCGQLVYSEARGWRFTSQTGEFEDTTDVFVKALKDNSDEPLP